MGHAGLPAVGYHESVKSSSNELRSHRPFPYVTRAALRRIDPGDPSDFLVTS